jgi:hypothetical protein
MNAENDEARQMWRELESSHSKAAAEAPPALPGVLACEWIRVQEGERQMSYARWDVYWRDLNDALQRGRRIQREAERFRRRNNWLFGAFLGFMGGALMLAVYTWLER